MRTASSWSRTPTRGRGAALGTRSARSRARRRGGRLGGALARVPPAGARRAALDRAALGDAADAGAIAIVVDPGRAFGTGAHATTRLCLELLADLERGQRCSTSAAAPACSRSRRRGSASAPVLAVDHDAAAIEAARRNAAANGVEIEVRARPRSSRRALPAADLVVANISLETVERVVPRLDAAAVVTSGYLERNSPGARLSPRARGRRKEAGRPIFIGARSRVRRRGDVLGPVPRLQGLARRRARDPRAPARRRTRGARRRRRRRRRQHLLRHARGGAQVAPGRRARGAHAPARLCHRLRREPRRRRASPGLPDNVVVVARRSEETPAFVAGDVGAIGCVQADARLDRVRAFVKVQDGCSFSCNFCVIPLVRGASRSRAAEAVLARSGAASARATARSC